MFTIFLENQHVRAQAGWYTTERKKRVDLWVSVYAGIKTQTIRDELNQTLDYASLVGIVITESSKERKLLETLALDIVAAIEAENHAILESVKVIIRKKHVAVTGFEADSLGIRFEKKYP